MLDHTFEDTNGYAVIRVINDNKFLIAYFIYKEHAEAYAESYYYINGLEEKLLIVEADAMIDLVEGAEFIEVDKTVKENKNEK